MSGRLGAEVTPRGQLAGLGTLLALGGGLAMHAHHAGMHEQNEISPVAHWLRDSVLAIPLGVLAVLVASLVAQSILRRVSRRDNGPAAHLTWAAVATFAYAILTIPGNWVHNRSFVGAAAHAAHDADAHGHEGFVLHAATDALKVIPPTFVLMLTAAVLVGLPWGWRTVPWRDAAATLRVSRSGRRGFGYAALATLTGVVPLVPVALGEQQAAAASGAFTCGMWPGTTTVVADVVALDQELIYNRLGVVNPTGMIYALRSDVVDKTSAKSEAEGATLSPGNVMLRPDKRPRPLTLRVNVGDCLEIHFTNLLNPVALSDQPADRNAGIHVNGLQVVGDITGDGSFVGNNPSGLVGPGGSQTYTLFAEFENTYLLYSMGATIGSEGGGGAVSSGLFGAVNVEPWGTRSYRSQLTRLEMDLAASAWIRTGGSTWTAVNEPQVDATGQLAVRLTPDGQPIMNYDARYPTATTTPGFDRAKAGRPIVSVLDGNRIVHSDLNAVIAGPAATGYRIPNQAYPTSYWANQIANLNVDRGGEPFREFTVIFHDEIRALQAFPDFFDDPVLSHTLQGVKDGFGINYGTGGIGAEIIANRIGVGPERDCVECKYEEFFLSSWAVGDPAIVVDVPANADAAGVPTNQGGGAVAPGAKANKALYPEDPANVHHSYIGDRVKFRNLHAGPKEHHIFHLHAQQWQYDPNSEKSAYLDSQNIGPGGGFTYEIAYGGSGNRNAAAGDMIFHCHFYPHFAQGMWEMWRVHDTFERGTQLTAVSPDAKSPVEASGAPVAGSRALPDGEIAVGTPIPALVPLPSRPMAPAPGAATVAADGASSQIDIDADGVPDFREIDPVTGKSFATDMPAKNPGYPFWVPGVAGHRPPTAPLDIAVGANGATIDGGLDRHVIVGGTAVTYTTRLDFNKELETARLAYVPENGTPAERAAMQFHAGANPATYKPDGSPATYVVNGLAPQPGAPFADPCRNDGAVGSPINPGSATNRTYKAAVIQLGLTMNKEGWHFQQQRILALNQDVQPFLAGQKAPEPLVMRIDAGDCVRFEHTNLTPNVYEMDDFQVRTPTDVIGQHIHLVKFDVTASDGSGNGFNYEDGTFSPQEVQERITAVRHGSDLGHPVPSGPSYCTAINGADGDSRLNHGETATAACPLAELHPEFGAVAQVGDLAWGARTTVQRWYADPLLNNSWDGGHGSVFTHDHFGPSTHQQVGLYATVLVEPKGSEWLHNETGARLGSRSDGGPTTWQAQIVDLDGGTLPGFEAHREFYFEYADFQHAYESGGGRKTTLDNGAGKLITSYADWRKAINPSVNQEPPSGHESDLFWFPPTCPGGVPRPCPEAISASDPGTYVVNYRNEPVGLRVFDPATQAQATGDAGDLTFAYASIPRADAALNRQPTTYPPLTEDVGPYDPYTPIIRAYMGDKVRVRVQVGAHEEEHTFTIHGMKWKQEPLNPNSGWRNSGSSGISEYFVLDTPVIADMASGSPAKVDYLYTMGASTEDLWNGVWGLFRSYGKRRADLAVLPTSPMSSVGVNKSLQVNNIADFSPNSNSECPTNAPLRTYKVAAVRAPDVLGPNGIVYNNRTSGLGPLQDPGALMYVMTDSVVLDANGKPVGLKSGTPIDPLVLRANAGECIQTELTNLLPVSAPDLPGYNALPPIVKKNALVNGGIVTFNSNDLRPSNVVGFTPQLVHVNMRTDGGMVVGGNSAAPVRPGQKARYTWYAGDISMVNRGNGTVDIVARPVEFGTANLMPSDTIEGASKGLVGALVVEPPGSTWTTDPNSNVSATVRFPVGAATKEFREFVTVLQNDVNLRWGAGCTPSQANLSCAVRNLKDADDPQDTGAKAINYGAEPLWYRLGLAPETDFGTLADSTDAHRVFSNGLVGADPQTAVFTVSPARDQFVRMRVLSPGGHARGIEFTTHGHPWQHQPYVQNSDRMAWDFQSDPTNFAGTPASGDTGDHNVVSWWVSSQESISASSHYDMQFEAGGGRNRTTGDFLFRDYASFGSLGGLWGIIRHERSGAIPAPDTYSAGSATTFAVATVDSSVLTNDLDLDGDPIAVTAIAGTGPMTSAADGSMTVATTGGSVTVRPNGTFSWTRRTGFTGTDSFVYTTTGGATATVRIESTTATASSPNRAPTAKNGTASTVSGVPVTVAVVGNCTNALACDPDGDVLRLTTTDANATVTGTTSLTFTPPSGFGGIRTIPYTVTDPSGASATASIVVTVAATDTLSVSSAVYASKQARWTVQGSVAPVAAGVTITVRNGTKLIGTATTDSTGAWQLTAGVAVTPCGGTVTATSSRGGVGSLAVTCR